LPWRLRTARHCRARRTDPDSPGGRCRRQPPL